MDLETVRPGCEALATEADVGISTFLNSAPERQPWTALFKSRPFDFVVNEVDMRGEVVHLRDVTVPAAEARLEPDDLPIDTEEGEKAMRAILPAETVTAFLAFLAGEKARVLAWWGAHPRPKRPQGVDFLIDSSVSMDKAQRTAVHDAVRNHYPFLISDAVNADYKPITIEASTEAADATASTGAAASAAEGGVSAATTPAEPVAVPYRSAASMITDAEAMYSTNTREEHPSVAAAAAQKAEEQARAAKRHKPAPEAKLVANSVSASSPPAAPVAVADGAAAAPAAPVERKLRLRFAALTSKDQRDTRVNAWPRARPDYLSFTLYKENMGTLDALQHLATQTRLNLKLFGFAGTKDKRAVTAQKCTAYRVAADKFRFVDAKIGGGHHGGTVRVGDFDYVAAPLRLGDLSGNEFQIVLRNIQGVAESEMEDLLRGVAQRGFVNYYGMQRFGTNAIATHVIGRALLRDDYTEAVSLLLMPRAGERDDVRTAREYYARTRHIEGALARMPGFMKTEADILRVLQSQGIRATRNAIETAVPRATRLMFVHAWQSWIWNTLASARVDLDAHAVREGDLVIDREAAKVDEAQRAKERAVAAGKDAAAEEKKVAEEMAATGDSAMTDAASTDATGADAAAPDADAVALVSLEPEERSWTTADVHVVTASDVSSGRYLLSDVVLPLPGFDVVYPTNSIGEMAKEMLAKEGIDLSRDQKGKHKDFSLSGAYRRIVQVPSHMEWKVLHYASPHENLSGPTDWQRVREQIDRRREAERVEAAARARAEEAETRKNAQAVMPPQEADAVRVKKEEGAAAEVSVKKEEGAAEDGVKVKMEDDAAAAAAAAAAASVPVRPPAIERPESEQAQEEEPRLLGLHLTFQLPSSTYATMLLRELMKQTTATGEQRGRAKEHFGPAGASGFGGQQQRGEVKKEGQEQEQEQSTETAAAVEADEHMDADAPAGEAPAE